jgi:hypothetical protein
MSLLTRRAAAASSFDAIPLKSPMSLWDLPTPALVIDAEAMESNLAKMSAFAEGKKIELRPHTKTHKCPIIAKKQIAGGAVGVCAAKVSEAEVMVDAGIENVLVTSPVVTKEKIDRMLALAKKSPGVAIVVDQEENVRDTTTPHGPRDQASVLIDQRRNRTGIAIGSHSRPRRGYDRAAPRSFQVSGIRWSYHAPAGFRVSNRPRKRRWAGPSSSSTSSAVSKFCSDQGTGRTTSTPIITDLQVGFPLHGRELPERGRAERIGLR